MILKCRTTARLFLLLQTVDRHFESSDKKWAIAPWRHPQTVPPLRVFRVAYVFEKVSRVCFCANRGGKAAITQDYGVFQVPETLRGQGRYPPKNKADMPRQARLSGRPPLVGFHQRKTHGRPVGGLVLLALCGMHSIQPRSIFRQGSRYPACHNTQQTRKQLMQPWLIACRSLQLWKTVCDAAPQGRTAKPL